MTREPIPFPENFVSSSFVVVFSYSPRQCRFRNLLVSNVSVATESSQTKEFERQIVEITNINITSLHQFTEETAECYLEVEISFERASRSTIRRSRHPDDHRSRESS